MFSKNWKVSFSQYTDGRIEMFRTADSAIKYIKEHFNEAPYIDLENEQEKINIRLKSPDKHAWTRGLIIN